MSKNIERMVEVRERNSVTWEKLLLGGGLTLEGMLGFQVADGEMDQPVADFKALMAGRQVGLTKFEQDIKTLAESLVVAGQKTKRPTLGDAKPAVSDESVSESEVDMGRYGWKSRRQIEKERGQIQVMSYNPTEVARLIGVPETYIKLQSICGEENAGLKFGSVTAIPILVNPNPKFEEQYMAENARLEEERIARENEKIARREKAEKMMRGVARGVGTFAKGMVEFTGMVAMVILDPVLMQVDSQKLDRRLRSAAKVFNQIQADSVGAIVKAHTDEMVARLTENPRADITGDVKNPKTQKYIGSMAKECRKSGNTLLKAGKNFLNFVDEVGRLGIETGMTKEEQVMLALGLR